MPTYSYRCKNCDHSFERFEKMADMDKALSEPCPECQTEDQIVMQITHLAPPVDPIRLMGSGAKLPSDWREFLGKMKKANPDGYIRDR